MFHITTHTLDRKAAVWGKLVPAHTSEFEKIGVNGETVWGHSVGTGSYTARSSNNVKDFISFQSTWPKRNYF